MGIVIWTWTVIIKEVSVWTAAECLNISCLLLLEGLIYLRLLILHMEDVGGNPSVQLWKDWRLLRWEIVDMHLSSFFD
jgi:hypothetical protein